MKPIVEVHNLFVKAEGRKPFRGRSWVLLFLEEELRELDRASAAVLFTLLLESSPRRDILTSHRGVLSGLFSRPVLSESLHKMEDSGLIYRAQAQIFLNPYVAYSGPATRYIKALEAWQRLREAQKEDENDRQELQEST